MSKDNPEIILDTENEKEKQIYAELDIENMSCIVIKPWKEYGIKEFSLILRKIYGSRSNKFFFIRSLILLCLVPGCVNLNFAGYN